MALPSTDALLCLYLVPDEVRSREPVSIRPRPHFYFVDQRQQLPHAFPFEKLGPDVGLKCCDLRRPTRESKICGVLGSGKNR